MERMENMQSGQTLKTVVTSVAQHDKLSSPQEMALLASKISTGLLDAPSLGSEAKSMLTVGLLVNKLKSLLDSHIHTYLEMT